MDAIKVGIREFRSQLPHYLLGVGMPVAITRHGETVGYYIPSLEKDTGDDVRALRTAAAKLDALLQSAQADTESLVSEYSARRHSKSR